MAKRVKDSYAGFACFSITDEAQINGFVISPDRKEVDEWRDSKSKNDAAKTADKSVDDEDDAVAIKPTSDISDLIDPFLEAISGFHQLVAVNAVMPPHIRMAFLRMEMFEPAKREYSVVKADDKYPIFGMNSEQLVALNRLAIRMKEMDRGFDALPSAVLLSLVASFDSYVADVVRLLLNKRPQHYENSQRTLTVKEIISMSSFEELRVKLVDDEVDSLMRGSHDEQVRYIETGFDVKIRDSYDRWPQFVEIFERRNLAAHGNLRVNKYYYDNCSKAGLKNLPNVGSKLELSPKYLHSAVDQLLEFGILLMFVLWRKHFDDVDHASFKQLNDVTYSLIKNKRTKVAAKLLEFGLYKQNVKSIPDSLRRMMIVNLANAQKKSGNKERALGILDETDWSATADEFKISVASIREDLEEVIRLMPKVVSGGAVDKFSFRDWPVFDWVKGDPRFCEKFQELFGEPFGSPEAIPAVEIERVEPEDDGEGLGEVTKH